MINSNVIILFSHGNRDDNGTFMWIDKNRNNTLHSQDMCNNNIDLSDCDVAAFVGCYTADHPTQSLPQIAVNLGADVGIGFTESIYINEAKEWTISFSLYNTTGYDAVTSAYKALQDIEAGSSINSIVIITQPN
jgi:hypothetical protein